MKHERIEQGKKRRRKERRADKQDLAQAARADNWEDRDGRARPTKERLARGQWEIRDTEDAGISHAIDTQAHMLDQMGAKGLLTPDQVQAGFDFADLWARNRMTSEGRSCLDFSPVGHDANLPDDERAARDYRELYLCLGTLRWAECRRVCVEQKRPQDLDRLRDGLDWAVKFFKGA